MIARAWWMSLSLLAGAACHGGGEGKKVAQPPSNQVWLSQTQLESAKLSIAAVAEEDVGGAVVASGRVTFDDLRVAHVLSPVAGRVLRIEAQPGQRVKKGAPLLVLESPDVGAAFSDLAKAQADLIAADHELKRQKELSEAKAGSQRDLENAEDAYNKAKAEHERARRKAAMFRGGTLDNVTQEYTLRAPIDGEVIARNVNPGVEVQGQYSGGTPVELFTIGELDSVWVVADVFEIDLARVKVGARVVVRVASAPTAFAGTVDWVASSLDPASRTARVRCRIANPKRELKPEMYATVSIAVAERRALALPRSAILRLGEKDVVFVALPGGTKERMVFERREVEIDPDDEGELVPVDRGLAPGDRVVVSGGILLVGML